MGTVTRIPYRSFVDKKCKDCIYDPDQRGTWRKQVANCTTVSCPLWAIRPLPWPRPKKPIPTPLVPELPSDLGPSGHENEDKKAA